MITTSIPGAPIVPGAPPVPLAPLVPGAPPVPTSRAAWLRAWAWSTGATLLAAGAVTLCALPFWPPDDEGWDQLGWFIFTVAAVVVVAVPAGAITFGVRLRGSGDPHPVLTGAVVVPVALLLGAYTAGTGALLAPPVAFWLVSGFSRRRGTGVGAGPSSRVWQRATVAVLVCGLASAWTLDELGHRLGGLLHSELIV